MRMPTKEYKRKHNFRISWEKEKFCFNIFIHLSFLCMITKIFMRKKKFCLVIRSAVPGTYGKALKLLGNDLVTSRVGWQQSSWSSPSSQISYCVPPRKAPLSLSRALPSRSVISLDCWAGDLCRPASWAGSWCAEVGEPQCISWVPWAARDILRSVSLRVWWK